MGKRKLYSVDTPLAKFSCRPERVQPEGDKMRRRLKETFGSEDFVELVAEGKRRRYAISCPVNGCAYKGRDLGKHLTQKVHGWPAKEVTLTTSFIVRQYNYLTKEKSRHKPKLCSACSRFFDRLDNHLVTTHKIERSSEKHANLMSVLTEKSEQFLRKFKARTETPCKCSKNHACSPEQQCCRAGACTEQQICPCNAFGDSLHPVSAEHSISSFKTWLMKYKNLSDINASQVANHVTRIWSVLDESMSVSRNQLRDVQRLEDEYFNPILQMIAEQQQLPIHVQKIHTQPATVRTNLGSLKRFLLFLQTRKIHIGLSSTDMVHMRLKCDELMGRLKPYEQQRQQDLATLKAEELITPDMCEAYGRSEFVQHLVVSALTRLSLAENYFS